MAASAFVSLHGSLLRSPFLGTDRHHHYLKQHPSSTLHSKPSHEQLTPRAAKFNLLEIMGGRGLCNGEMGLQQELKRQVDNQQPRPPPPPPPEAEASGNKEQENSGDSALLCGNSVPLPAVSEDAFEKELMGLTGGFPGGEKGLQKFIEENPPQKIPETVI